MLLRSPGCVGGEGVKRIFLLLLFCAITPFLYGQPGCSLKVEAGRDTAICLGNSVQLKAVVTGVADKVKYTWKSSTGLAVDTIQNPGVNPVVTTRYKVTVEKNGCSASDSLTVAVNLPPVVNFSFTNNLCSGTPIAFVADVTGGTKPYTYTWNFGDNTPPVEAANPTHAFEALGCNIRIFNVTLTVTDANGCPAVKMIPVSVKEKPDIDFQDVNHPFEPFSNCSNASAANPVYSITVGNNSTSNCVTDYSINWGDGTSQSNINFPLSHTYNQLGAFEMIITATGTNGCSNSKRYTVKNVSNPSGGINSPGSTTNLCAPTDSLQFEISKWGANSPGTVYEIDYGDGSPLLRLTHEQLVKSSFYNVASPADSRNYPVPHVYSITSCNANGGLFTVTLRVTNACGETKGTVSNISILKKPTAGFTGPSTACVNTSLTFYNTTDPGYNVNCSQNAIYSWEFGDGTPVISTPPQSAKHITHQYANPGTYEVILTVQNLCGMTTAKRTICIVPALIASFDMTPLEGCAPRVAVLSSTIDISQSCSDLFYNWEISFNKTGCDNTGSFEYLNGTNRFSKSAFVIFYNSGTYTIKLTVSNACGTFSASKTLEIKKPPQVSINPITPVCQSFPATTIFPTLDITTCGSKNLTYHWSFPGGSPAESDLSNPVVTYDEPGTYSVSVTVTGDCGVSTASSSFVINPTPLLTDLPDLLKCPGQASDPINFVSSLPNTLFNWTNSNTKIGLPASGTGNINSFTLQNNTYSVQQAIITVTPKITLTNCTGPSKSFTISVNPTPVVNNISNITLCNQGVRNEIAISGPVAGTVFSWKNSNPDIGLQAEGAGNIPSFTAVNNGTDTISALITITPSANGCTGPPKAFRIIVKPTPDVLTIPDLEFCNGINTDLISFNSTVKGTSYSWTNSNPAIGLGASGSGTIPSFKARNSGSSPIFSTIIVSPSSNGCDGDPKSFKIKVQPAAAVLFSLPNQILCSGEASNSVELSSPTPDVLFSWTAEIPNGITGAELSGTTVIPVQSLINTTAAPLTITYHAIASIAGGSACEGIPYNYTITVNPRPKISAIGPLSVCSGEKLVVSPGRDNGNILPDGTTYTWSDPIITPAGVGITGAVAQSSPQMKFSQTLSNNSNDTATVIYTVTPSFQSCAGEPFKITIHLNPIPSVSNPGDLVFCSGQQFPGIQFQGNVSGSSYSWSCNQNIGAEVSGTGDLPSFTLVNPGNTPLTATFTVTPSANGCTGSSSSFNIKVNPIPAITNPDREKVVCNGAPTSIQLASNVTGTDFSWTAQSSSDHLKGFSTNGNGSLINDILLNDGDTPEIVTYTITPIANNCAGLPVDFKVTVEPVAKVIHLTDQTICSGAVYEPISLTSNVSGASFHWTVMAPPGVTGFATSGSGQMIPGNTVQSSSSGIEQIRYIIFPVVNGCEGEPDTLNILVYPAPQITNLLSQTICSGEKTSPVILQSNIEGVSFSWNVSPIPDVAIGGYLSSGNDSIGGQTIFNSGNSIGRVVYHIVPVSALNCRGIPADYVLTVNPLPKATVNVEESTICSGETTGIRFSSSLSNTIFTWTIDSISENITGAVVGNGNVLAQKLINLSQNPGKVRYKIIPGVGSCKGEAVYASVLVNPRPVPSIQGESRLCIGTTEAVYETETGMSGYEWSLASGGTITEGQGSNKIKVSWTSSGDHRISVNYRNEYSCNALVPGFIDVSVFPILPVSVTIVSDQNSVCPGTTVTFTANPVNGGSHPLYQWKVNDVMVGSSQSSYAYIPRDGDHIQCILTSDILCTSGNPATSNIIDMVVYSDLPAGVTISGGGTDICPGETASFIAEPFNGGANPVYQWLVNGMVQGSNQPFFQYEPVNGDIVQCRMISGNRCSTNGIALSNQLTMKVSPPGLIPSFAIEVLKDCTPMQVRLRNDSPAGGLAYIWDLGDGTTLTSDSPMDVLHTFENFTSTPKVFTISLKVVTRFTHCFNIVTRQITVKPELFAGSPVEYSGCSPFVHKFENAYPGAKSYKWIDSNGIILSTELQPTLSFSSSAKRDSIHRVYLVAESDYGCTDTIVNTIKVSPTLEMPSFSFTSNPDCRSVQYLFQNASPEGADRFIWDFNDGTINTTYHANEMVTHTFYNGTDVPLTFNITLTSRSGSYCALSVNQKVTIEPEYTGGFPVSFQGCSPLTRQFKNAYGGAKSYQWKTPEGKVLSTLQNPSLTFTAPLSRDTTYFLYLITESMSGCLDTVLNKIMVHAADPAQFVVSSLEGCAPLAISFTNTSSSKVTNYEWNFGDGSDVSILKSPRHIYIDPEGKERNYQVMLIGFNQYGCTDTILRKIHLFPTPQVNFTAQPDFQIFPNTTVQLTNLTPKGDWEYSWNYGDQKTPQTGEVSSYSYDSPGEYVISLTGKGAQCERTVRQKVIINPGTPLAVFEPDTSGCAPLKVKFRNYSKNSILYSWDFGNGSQSVDFEPTITFYDAGIYTITLKTFNQFGEMATAQKQIIVHPVPMAHFKPLPFKVKIPGQAVTFFNNSVNAENYLWDFGDGNSSRDREPTHEYTQTGKFDVTLYITSRENCPDTLKLADAVEAFSDELKVPNAFIPSKEGPSGGNYVPGDPANHVFYPVLASGDVVYFEFLIYNRWGNLVFSSHEAGKGWDGYYMGRLCPQDVYVWKIRCTFRSGNTVTKTGDVTLIQ